MSHIESEYGGNQDMLPDDEKAKWDSACNRAVLAVLDLCTIYDENRMDEIARYYFHVDMDDLSSLFESLKTIGG